MVYTPLKNWIYVFHMPLFFFLSGYLFRFDRHPDFMPFVRRRFRQLMYPYIVINLVTFAFWALVSRNMGAETDDTPLWPPLLAACLGNGPDMVHDVPLWFLMCLFEVECIYHLVFRHRTTFQRLLLALGIALVGWANYRFNPITLPFSFGTTLVAIVFYALGHEAHHIRRHPHPLWAVGACVVTIGVGYANGRINMHRNYYADYALFFLGALAGILMVMTLCREGNRHLPERLKKGVRFVARHTLFICGYQFLAFSFINGALFYGFQFRTSRLEEKILGPFLLALAATALCLLGAEIQQRSIAWWQKRHGIGRIF